MSAQSKTIANGVVLLCPQVVGTGARPVLSLVHQHFKYG